MLNVQKSSLEDYGNWAISMLAAVHKISTFEVMFTVQELQRKSLIDESTLRTHDLYIEFARSVVSMEGSKEKEWWVGHRDANGYNLALRRLLLFEDASKIFQLSPPKQLWECPNLECLIMHNCKVTLKPKLDLKRFTNLRLLMITDYTSYESPFQNTMEIVCTSDDAVDSDLNSSRRKDQSKGCLPELRMVKLFGFDLRRIPFLRQCWNLTFLSVYNFNFDSSDFPRNGTSLFENLKALETLILSSSMRASVPSCVFDGLLRGATKLRNLKFLEIDLRRSSVDGGGFSKLDLSPLERLTSLQTLSLPSLPYCIEELIGLDQLSQLSELNLQYCRELRKLPNLDRLPNLQRICVDFCLDLKLPKDQLKRFQELHPPGYDAKHKCLEPSSRPGQVIIDYDYRFYESVVERS